MTCAKPDPTPAIAWRPETDTAAMTVTPTCASCKYWFRVPINPQNVTAPRPGECKHHLVALPLLNEQGQVSSWVGGFPPTPPDFWCGRHKPRIDGGG